MASFGYGWPKVLSPKLHNESLSLESETFYPIDLVIDEHRSKLAVLYDDRVVFWTTGRIRVVTGKLSLCRYNKEKGSVKGCCFRYDGNRCAILLERSFLLIYKLEPFHAPPGRSSWFDFVSSSEGNSQEKESQSTNKWADEYILPILLIEKDISSSEEESILACKSCPSGIILVNSTLEVICVSWEGELFWRTSIGRLLSLDTIGCENGRSEGSVSLDYHNGTDLCGLTLNFSGVALLLKVGEEGHSLPGIDDCFILRENDASCIALEPQQCLAAVGLRNGSVEIYNTSVFLTGQPVCLRSLSLDSLYFSVSDIGRVVSLQWTSDGNCIAVGYEKAGVVVWSNFGHCVFHTFSSFEHPKEEMRYLAETIQEMQNNHEQLGQTDPSSSIYGETKMESFKQGYLFRHTKAVCWGAFGYSLFVLGSIDYTRNHWEAQSFVPFLLFELSFLKTGFSKGSCQNEATRSFLLGPDFFVSEDNAMIHYPDMMSSKKKMIRHIEAPYEYVSNNWPLRSISVNDDKSFVAVSGKHGVAIYNTRSRRWRLFGDVVEERMIQCCSLCWYGRSIIIGNELAIQNRKTHRYELLIFPRDSLYFSAIQAQIPLQGAPLLLDARKDGFVLVFADDLQLRLLKLESDRSKTKFTYSTCWTFHITVEAPLASPRRITRWRSCGTFVSSVRLYPKQPCENDIPYQVLLLKSTGSLILLDISNGISVPLLRMVHSFWFHNTDCLPVGTVNSPPLIIWAVAEEGIYCLFDSSCTQVDSVSPSLTQSPSNMAYNSRFVSHKWFHGDLNIYPLGVVGFGGFLAGVCPLQTASVTITLDNIYCRLPCFGIQIERQEFISKLFLCWLADETLEDMQCLKWMESCSEWEHFENCLERCLYELLIHVEAKRNNRSLSHEETSELQVMEPLPSTSLTFSINEEYALDRFMRLAKYFGEYEDVIVGCARKMDRKYWNLLFSYVGEPCLLFENCCLTKRLTIAAAFLKVIQEWWDLQVAAMHAWRLLQSCLNEERIDIAEQVVLFLGRAAMEGLFSYPDFEIREEDKRLLENGVVVGCNDDRAVHPVNALLLQNMGKCLERMQWRQALNISMCFGISLADYWKVMESSFQYKPLSHVLLSLHNSFQWPFPSSDVVCKKWRLLGEDLLVSNEEQVFEKLYDWKKITFQYEKLNGYKGEKYYQIIRQRLQYLTGHAFVSEQWELVLCGLTMLLSCEELRVLLNLHTGWVASYVEGLEKTHIAGYATLASKWYS